MGLFSSITSLKQQNNTTHTAGGRSEMHCDGSSLFPTTGEECVLSAPTGSAPNRVLAHDNVEANWHNFQVAACNLQLRE